MTATMRASVNYDENVEIVPESYDVGYVGAYDRDWVLNRYNRKAS